MPFYAVANGRSPGIYNSWDECRGQTDNYSGAAFKKFSSEAECKQFIAERSGGGGGASSSAYVEPPRPVAQRASYAQPSGSNFATSGSNFATSGGSGYGYAQRGAQYTPSARSASATSSNGAGRALEFNQDNHGYVQVYTDGSCLNNGKSNAKAGLGVYFGEGHPLNKSEPVRGRPTNNSGEIQASIEAIKSAKGQGIKKLCINTDSKFVMDSMTQWAPEWKAKGWKLANGDPVKNETDFKELDRLCNDNSMDIKWNHVNAHAGTLGNERADQLAKGGAEKWTPSHSKR